MGVFSGNKTGFVRPGHTYTPHVYMYIHCAHRLTQIHTQWKPYKHTHYIIYILLIFIYTLLGPTTKNSSVSLGKIQDLMTEALDGFVLVLLGDGTIVYLSDNIHKYLGLFQVFTLYITNVCM